jgi:hypothetical protein
MKKFGGKFLNKAKGLAETTISTAKETVAGAMLGDDFGEALLERLDGDDDEEVSQNCTLYVRSIMDTQ